MKCENGIDVLRGIKVKGTYTNVEISRYLILIVRLIFWQTW